MSKLQDRRTRLVFETSDETRERGKHRPVIVEAFPTHAVLRLKGMRKGIAVSWLGMLQHGIKLEVERAKAEKRAAKKAAR